MAFYLEKDFFEDVELFNLTQQVMTGNLTLRWFDPKTERVTVYRSLLRPRILTRDDALDGEDVLPGFSVAVSELFDA